MDDLKSELPSGDRPATVRHSGLGIASFTLSLTCLVALLILSVIANQSRPEGPGIIVTTALCSVFFLSLVSILLGLCSLFQPNRNKLFGILGIVFGAGPILLLG